MTVTRRGPTRCRRDDRQRTRALLSNLSDGLIWYASMIATKPIIVAGAGSIGCFVGGALANAGRRVSLLARPRVIDEINRNGLRVTSFEGFDRMLSPGRLSLSEDPSIFKDAGVVLVTVKSTDTADIAGLIAQHAPPEAAIVSLQNGVGNVAVLRQRLPA